MTPYENYIAFSTIVRKEVVRFFRIWTQTLIPPVITQSLYFVIFGKFIGSQVGSIHGVSYMSFIIPGLVMMSVINNSFANVVSSFFSAKFQRSIEELLVSPMPDWVVVGGYVVGGVLRGIVCGFLVFAISLFFSYPVVHHIGFVIIFVLLTSIVFSLAGFLNALYAKKFDDVTIFPTFILTPLIYLGGVFYSIHNLPDVWQKVSYINPILYMVNGFRFGFYGISDVNVYFSILTLIMMAIILAVLNLYLMHKGTGLRA